MHSDTVVNTNTIQQKEEKYIMSISTPEGIIRCISDEYRDIGHRVIIETRNRKYIGILIDLRREKAGKYTPKDIQNTENNTNIKVIFPDEAPIITKEMVMLCRKVSERYLAPLRSVLSLACPTSYLKLEVKLKEKEDEKKFGRAKKVFKILGQKKGKKMSLSQAKKLFKFETLLKLERNRLIEIVPMKKFKSEEEIKREFEKLCSAQKVKEGGAQENNNSNNNNNNNNNNKILTQEQISAIEDILENQKSLIFGVTGSGKTEVYLRAIKECGGGAGAIFLLPEISLTTFILNRVKENLKSVAVIHSGLSEKEREINWWALRYGIVKYVVGARSAVFAPVQNLKVIVLDEEHDQSYKQSPGQSSDVFYDAREVAEMRADIEGAKLIMGSATPSITSFYRALKGEIKLIRMMKRVPGMEYPETIIIDLKKEKYDDFISFPLSDKMKEEIEKRIEKGESIILLFTRRGWGLYIMCLQCSYKFRCSSCNTSLVYHKKEGLVCHWCGRIYYNTTPSFCPKCGSKDLEVVGFGTERIEEELSSIFKVPVFRMDSDIAKSAKDAKKILDQFSNSSPAILVGTQMVSKGFDFPQVTLVGVILADTEFLFSDYRADERAFQLLMQVVGRAGRSRDNTIADNMISKKTTKALSIIQTFSPEHPVIKYAVEGNYELFFREEIEKRKELGFPPLSGLVSVNISCHEEALCWNIARELKEKLSEKGIRCDGPAKAVRYLIAGKYNIRIIGYIQQQDDTQKIKSVFRKSQFFIRGAKVTVDINPVEVI